MNLEEFLTHLRDRLIVVMIGFLVVFLIGFSFARELSWLLPDWLVAALARSANASRRFSYADITQTLFFEMRIALFGAVCWSLAFIAVQEWMFRRHRGGA